LGAGVVTTLLWGYSYGILRAHFATSASHFLFDSGLLGLYVATAKVIFGTPSRSTRTLTLWASLLFLWPCVVFFFPFQPFMVSLVGLRGAVWFLPMLLIGSRLKDADLLIIAKALGILNVAALAFAVAEYQLGVQTFYPYNEATSLIYASNDVSGGYLRIPATFVTAHMFGGVMISSLPLLVGLFARKDRTFFAGLVAAGGVLAALIGVFLSATRLNFVCAAVIALRIVMSSGLNHKMRGALIVILLICGWFGMNNERTSRFKSLGDNGTITGRIGGSVNRSFWEIIRDNPMGNGLGGGGTSMPYFLQGQIRHPIEIESEYARFSLEQGMPALFIWLAFICWVLTSSSAAPESSWKIARDIAWVYILMTWIIAWIGLGTLTSIPASATLLMTMGWISTRSEGQSSANRSLSRSADLVYAG
jgi:hypothetical protein